MRCSRSSPGTAPALLSNLRWESKRHPEAVTFVCDTADWPECAMLYHYAWIPSRALSHQAMRLDIASNRHYRPFPTAATLCRAFPAKHPYCERPQSHYRVGGRRSRGLSCSIPRSVAEGHARWAVSRWSSQSQGPATGPCCIHRRERSTILPNRADHNHKERHSVYA
jgi:hypothetical protein